MELLDYLLMNGLQWETLIENGVSICPNVGDIDINQVGEYTRGDKYIYRGKQSGLLFTTNDIKGYLTKNVDGLIKAIEWEFGELEGLFNGVVGFDKFDTFGELMQVVEWDKEEIAMMLLSGIDKGYLVWESSDNYYAFSKDKKGAMIALINWWYNDER